MKTHSVADIHKKSVHLDNKVSVHVTANPDSLMALPKIFGLNNRKSSSRGLLHCQLTASASSFLENHTKSSVPNVRYSNIFCSSKPCDLNSEFKQSTNGKPSRKKKLTDNTDIIIKEKNRKLVDDGNNNIDSVKHDQNKTIDLNTNSGGNKMMSNTTSTVSSSLEITNIDCPAKYYRVLNKNMYLLHLPVDRKFTLHGKLRLSIVSGDIEIFGFNLNKYSKIKSVDVFSPRRCMQVMVTSKLPTSCTPITEVAELIKSEIELSQENAKFLLDHYKPHDTLLIAEPILTNFTAVLNHYLDTDLFYEKDIALDSSEVFQKLKCILNFSSQYKRRGFTKGLNWDDMNIEKRTVVCGGKGVGKSTLLKYLINRKLSNEESVLCLDLDPGQTEFTPPGSVCAVLIKSPLLGPNFTHMTDPEKMVYIGEVNVGLNPTKYMQAANFIIKYCEEDPELSHLPWCINTMGFNKGIGVDIMINLIMLLKPDVLIQIYSSDVTRNYPFKLSAQNMASIEPLFIPSDGNDLSYTYYELNSCARMQGVGFQSGFRPAELRELMTLSYFSQIVPFPYYSLNAAQPLWISFSSVYLALDAPVSPSDILKAFNGSLVGLCHLKEEMCEEILEAEQENLYYFKIAIKPSTMPCFGLGIVRCIDVQEKRIYILTHLSNMKLKNVNCLTMGRLSPPHCIYLKQFYVDGLIPYTSVNRSKNIQGIKREFKFRHSIR